MDKRNEEEGEGRERGFKFGLERMYHFLVDVAMSRCMIVTFQDCKKEKPDHQVCSTWSFAV